MSTGFDYDVIVIGAGAAGLFASENLVRQGARTCLVEKGKLGGDCTWYGCIPSKTLLKSAAIAQKIKDASVFGLKTGDIGLNTSGVMPHIRDIRRQIGAGETPEIMRNKGIDVLIGSAEFTGRDTVRGGDRICRARRYIIATGSQPAIPPVEGIRNVPYLTNETFFELDELPSSLLVLGGGPVGVELAQAAARLGVRVTMVEMTDRILPMEDEELVRLVACRLRQEGVDLKTGRKAVRLAATAEGISATLENRRGEQENVEAEKLLLASGRVPNTAGLELATAGVELSDGWIGTNEYLQTSNPHIFACGDVVGPYMFTHTAAYQAYVCTRNALFRRPVWQKVDYGNVAWANFIDPEIAHLGLTEEQARERHSRVRVYTSDYTAVDRAYTDAAKEGMIKVITDRKGYILGAHIAGEQAAEIIHPLVIAKTKHMKLAELAPVMFIYPTLSGLVRKTAARPLQEFLDRPMIKWVLRLLRKV